MEWTCVTRGSLIGANRAMTGVSGSDDRECTCMRTLQTTSTASSNPLSSLPSKVHLTSPSVEDDSDVERASLL